MWNNNMSHMMHVKVLNMRPVLLWRRIKFLAASVTVTLVGLVLIQSWFELVNKMTSSNDGCGSLVESFRCRSGVPCEYPVEDEVRIRIIVLTFDRWESLLKLLSSMNDLYMDGDRGSIEIWIDRSNTTNEVSKQVLRCAESFVWKHGRVRVHVQDHHVGIYGQWIDTWRPRLPLTSSASCPLSSSSEEELVLYLEDDMILSPFAYRWLRAAHLFYANRTDMAGITLHSEGLIVATSGKPFKSPPTSDLTFLYFVSSWGFAPRGTVWRQFQDWFHQMRKNNTFKPYVNKLIFTRWYKTFEKQHREDSMWTMWFIYYCEMKHLYTMYNNIHSYQATGNNTGLYLAVNRREPGLHYKINATRVIDASGLLLRSWSDDFVKFKQTVTVYNVDGKPARPDLP